MYPLPAQVPWSPLYFQYLVDPQEILESLDIRKPLLSLPACGVMPSPPAVMPPPPVESGGSSTSVAAVVGGVVGGLAGVGEWPATTRCCGGRLGVPPAAA